MSISCDDSSNVFANSLSEQMLFHRHCSYMVFLLYACACVCPNELGREISWSIQDTPCSVNLLHKLHTSAALLSSHCKPPADHLEKNNIHDCVNQNFRYKFVSYTSGT